MGIDFDAVFDAEFPALHRYLRRRVGADAADEIVASTFAIAFRNRDRFDSARPVRPWLFGIAANELRHHWRAERRMLRALARTGVDPVYSSEDELIRRADASALHRPLAAALASLKPRDREVLLLHAWAEMSDSEIADTLSLPTGTIKSSLHRTRDRIRNSLQCDGQQRARAAAILAAEDQR